MLRPLAALALLFVLACARMGAPPGGPADLVAPHLIATIPESLGVFPAWKRDVEFRFDETVSEGGSPSQGFGTGDLERLILLSPSDGVPHVSWKRSRITVRPKEGWKPNRAYRIELLPGITDLRRNRLDTTIVLAFSTGGPAPTDTLAGRVIDWVAGRSAAGSLVELVLLPDSLVYRTLADTGGRFSIGPLPRGQYLVYATLDQNKNLRRDRREAFDSVRMAAGGLTVAPLWTFPHDTAGPRIQGISPGDSQSATVAFTQPLDPFQRFDSLEARLLLLPDSTPVPLRSLLPKSLDDSLTAHARTQADSLREEEEFPSELDSAKALPPVNKPQKPQQPQQPQPAGQPARAARPAGPAVDSLLKTRPALFDRLILRSGQPLTPGARYALLLRGIRNAAGAASDPNGVLAVPLPKPPEAADSLAVPPGDSAAGRPPAPADSVSPPSPKP